MMGNGGAFAPKRPAWPAYCLFVAFAFAGIATTTDRAGAAVRLIAESDEQVLFEVVTPRPTVADVQVDGREYRSVSLAGAARPATPGVPDLPLAEFLVALPPGTTALTAIVEAEVEVLVRGRPVPIPEQRIFPGPGARPDPDEGLPRYEFEFSEDPLIYESPSVYPREIVTAGHARGWRHYQIAPVTVHPVQYDPGAGTLLWYPRLVVRVLFAPSPTPGSPEVRRPYPHNEGRWETLFKRSILNYRSARSYKQSVRSAAAPLRRRTTEPLFEFKIVVGAGGIYEVAFDDLTAAGLSEVDLGWDDLKIVLRDFDDSTGIADPFTEYPVAFLPLDADGDGRFASGESLVLYALDAWESFEFEPGEKRYGRENVYWLVYGDGAGPTMESRPAWFDWEGLSAPFTYQRTIHFEENFWYMPVSARGSNGDTRSPDPGPFAIRTDHYNWTYQGASAGTQAEPIKVISLDLPAVLRRVQFCTHLQGQYQSDYGHRPRLWLSNNDHTDIGEVWEDDWAFPGNPYQISNLYDLTVCLDGEEIPASYLGKGRTYLKIYLPAKSDGYDNIDADGVGINWAEATFDGLFEIWEHRLLAVLEGLDGHQQLAVKKIPGDAAIPPTADWFVFDVTDATAPAVVELADSLFEYSSSSKKWTLNLQVDCGTGSPPMKILVVERSHLDALPTGSISLRMAPIATDFTGSDYDYVAVYAQEFGDALEPLLAHRETQGHVVLRASVEGLCDAYSGGRRHPFAIKRLLRRMWQEQEEPPDYLLLMGDASNDIAGYALGVSTEQSDTNWVPTPTISGPWNELIPCDQWYVDNLLGEWEADMSYFPDMHLGRVSCGSPEEAELYVAKVLTYEQDDPTAAWRGRVVVVSDDTFSSRLSGIGGSGIYEYQGSEPSFLDISRNSVDSITRDSVFAHFEIDTLYVSMVMDTVLALGRCIPDPVDDTRCLCRSVPWPWSKATCYVSGGIDYDINKHFGESSSEYEGAGFKPLLMEALGRGALVWAFQGHSNRSLLSHEYIFRHSPRAGVTDVFDLTNNGQPFVFVGCGCHLADYASHWEGDYRRGDAMIETMLFCCAGQPRAAIGALASVDYEWIGHDYEEKFFEAMFEDPPRDLDYPEDPQGASRWRLGEVVSHSKFKVTEGDRNERITYVLLGDPGLRLGMAPPVIRLAMNGVEWEGGETGEYVSSREDDSLALVIRIFDDSRVTLEGLSDYYGTVPEDSLEFVDDGDDRTLEIRYATQVQRRPYEIVVHSSDYDGSERQTVVQIPMSVGIYEQLEEEIILLAEGDQLLSTSALTITLRCSAHLAPEDVTLLAGERSLEMLEWELDEQEGQPFFWTMRFGDLYGVPEGPVTLAVLVAQRDGGSETPASVLVNVGKVTLRFAEQPYWMPNPFGDQSYIVYDLTAGASRTQLRVFTSSGRCIFDDATLPTRKSVRHFLWDGRDADGDPVANGLYFYELSIWDDQGERADRVLDKVVRVR